MSAIVCVKGKNKLIHPTVVQFMKDIGVKLSLCKCRHPFTKGKVEVSNKYQNWLKSYDFRFKTKEDLIKGVEEILNQCNYQENSETKVAPIILFETEKKSLKPLPNKEMLKKYHSDFIEATVSNACLINYKGAKYGVESGYINSKIFITEEDGNLYLYNNDLIIIGSYPIYSSGIHYAKGLYSVCCRDGETQEQFNSRIENNLLMLAKLGNIKKGDVK